MAAKNGKCYAANWRYYRLKYTISAHCYNGGLGASRSPINLKSNSGKNKLVSASPQQSVTCEICGSHNVTLFDAAERMYGLGGSFSYVNCQDCRTIYQKDKLDDYSKFYPQNYYSFDLKKLGKHSLKQSFRFFKRLAFGHKGIKSIDMFEPYFGHVINVFSCATSYVQYEHIAIETDVSRNVGCSFIAE